MYPSEIYVEINPEDAKQIGVENEEYVQIVSRYGKICAMASISESVSSSELFIPMHYPSVNELIPGIFDPASRQPSYKLTAVNIERAVMS